MRRWVAVLTAMAFLAASTSGCFVHYHVSQEEFSKVSSGAQAPQTLASSQGEELEITGSSRLAVQSTGGREYLVTPYNFELTGSQLVAGDRDTLLRLDEIDDFEVQTLNIPAIVALSVLAAQILAGAIAITVVTAGTSSVYGK